MFKNGVNLFKIVSSSKWWISLRWCIYLHWQISSLLKFCDKIAYFYIKGMNSTTWWIPLRWWISINKMNFFKVRIGYPHIDNFIKSLNTIMLITFIKVMKFLNSGRSWQNKDINQQGSFHQTSSRCISSRLWIQWN